ncbi:MAG: DUF2785 domain-containing protein [Ilumatobacteraceae bacterium]
MTVMDRALWESIVASDAEVPPGHTAADLLPPLLDLLEEPDPFLRDEVGYGVLARWVVKDQLLGPSDLRYAVERLVPDLRHGLDDDDGGGDRAVLRRSYSALALAILAYRDVDDHFLDAAGVRGLLDDGLAYLLEEPDRRGWVAELGWVNATSHTADLLKFLVRNPATVADDHRRVLDALQTLLTKVNGLVFIDDEEDRLVLVVVDVLGRDTVDDDALVDWIDRFGSWLAEHPTSSDPEVRAAAVNVKRFIRALHLALCSRAHRGGSPHDSAELAALDTARRFAAGPI